MTIYGGGVYESAEAARAAGEAFRKRNDLNDETVVVEPANARVGCKTFTWRLGKPDGHKGMEHC